MGWQGSDPADGAGRDPGEDETRADWGDLGRNVGTPPIPDAPPPIPAGPPAGPPAPPAGPPAPPAPPPAPVPGAYGVPPGGAAVAWAPPNAAYTPTGLEVPGVPGLRFGGTLHRLLAYLIDGLLLGFGAGLIAGTVAAATSVSSMAALITAVVYVGLEFLYFVGMWTSSGRATLGMRVMKLQIGNAFDGRTLSVSQAVIRWVALGLPFQAAGFVPQLTGISGLVGLWALVLLISTAVSPTRQGIHDRLARSAIVQPIGASTPAAACLIVVLILVVLPLIAIVALILLGAQVSAILSSVGTSIQP